MNLYILRNLALVIIGIVFVSSPAQAQTPTPNPNRIQFISWSPDGKQIAFTNSSGITQLQNAVTAQTLVTIQTDTTGPTTSVAWSPDGTKLATGGIEETVRIWSSTTGSLLNTLPQMPYADTITSLAWSSDGTKLIQSSYSGDITVWNATTYEVVRSIVSPSSVVSISLSPDNSNLVASSGNAINVWNVADAQLTTKFVGHTGQITSVEWSPNSNTVASSALDNTIYTWTGSTGQKLKAFRAHTDVITGVSWRPNSTQFASASVDGSVRVWDSATGQLVNTITSATPVLAVAFSPDGSKLAYGGDNSGLQIVSVADVEAPNADTAQSYAYITQLASGDMQLNRINPLDPDMTLPPIPIGIPADHTVFQAIRSPDGNWIAMWVNWEGYFQLYVYEVSTSALYMAKQVHSLDLFDDRLITPVWSPNSQYVAFNIFDGTLYSTYLVTPTNRGILTIHSGSSDNALPLVYAIALAWSADTRYLAVVQNDCYNLLCTNNIRAFSVPDISEIAVVKIQGTICDVQWSPDNRRISFAQECDTQNIFYSSDVYIWDIGKSKADRLTDLSKNSSDSAWEQRYATERAAIWYDADTLLIGVVSAKIGLKPNLVFAETASYRPEIGRVANLSDEVATGWVRNKHSGEFAYYSASVHDVDEFGFNLDSGFIKIATFDGRTLSIIRQIDKPKMVNWTRPLAWSPDERFVAFSTIDPKSYQFLDKTTGKITQFGLPVTDFITVGWIAQ